MHIIHLFILLTGQILHIAIIVWMFSNTFLFVEANLCNLKTLREFSGFWHIEKVCLITCLTQGLR